PLLAEGAGAILLGVTAPPMKIRTLVVGPVACNCAIVACPETGQAAIIDPGGNTEDILAMVKDMGVTVTQLLHTHGHFDHILATGEVAAATGAAISIHRKDQNLYENLSGQGVMFGFRAARPPAPTQWLVGGETISVGQLAFQVLHTPGHTPGSVGFFLAGSAPVLFAGDTLFAESVGRTDLPGGSFVDIAASIRTKLYVLPEETRVIPGHGPETTIGYEREHNPFVSAVSG
ncbi:MAG TPA: MBL fold metallo-hydrolase, partial [Polyangia bacterium]